MHRCQLFDDPDRAILQGNVNDFLAAINPTGPVRVMFHTCIEPSPDSPRPMVRHYANIQYFSRAINPTPQTTP